MDHEETQLVTLENDNTINLYKLPHNFRCEKTRKIDIKVIGLEFSISMIAFSQDHKIIYIGCPNIIAAVRIDSVEAFFEPEFNVD